ncbi:hypothetical protein EWS92_09785 [Vibrio vulnificus]|uniref:hypothetical protein n=1 Tax=Vibrio vulnificus TaxID=672 RepID=UPI00102BC847|nr:hypothetical protein [Vibrio vulnificus]EGR0058105.1 hypothetical protein [Vibrio vulnificus]EGR0788007.1 hypothetical protein [Vibrio vulnificus]EGR0797322.1 hypothetical protein [Vibrio vulnificus]EGR0815752.1 hypothetical protein [Vibrio vulnificus]EGR0826302.1 hypothetical protein [Vibrio vulnificus]
MLLKKIVGISRMMKDFLSASLVKSMVRHFTDKFGQTIAEPKIGSILYTELLVDFMEHTGIYIGNGKIIELNSRGHITVVSPSEFVNGGTGINIYVSAQNGYPVGSSLIAERAIKFEKEIGVKNYNILFDNCHIFTSACIINELDNANSFLWMVKDLAKISIGADEWLVWKNYHRFDEVVKKNEPTKPRYTERDLEEARRALQECHDQSGRFWEEQKSIIDEQKKLYDNPPHNWIFYSQSKVDRWQKRVDELEQISQVLERKSNDQMAQMKACEDKISEIKTQLGI